MKPFLVQINESPETVLESFSTQELLYEILRREKIHHSEPYRLIVEHKEPVHEVIVGIGDDHTATIFIHQDTLEQLKDNLCLN
jgi:hypothetical protein